jgi:probable HAF family extracellular repeat protein
MKAVMIAGTLGLASGAMAQATFTPLGYLVETVPYSQGLGLSRSGNVVAGSSLLTGGIAGQSGAYWWSSETGLQSAFDIQGASSAAQCATPDGTVLAGWADFGAFSPLGVQAFLFSTATGTAQLLGDFTTNPSGVPRSYARAISADGSTIVGNGTSANGTEAFAYSVTGATFAGLGSLSSANFASWAYGVSGDGSVIVGSSYSAPQQLQAFRWSAASGMAAIPYLATNAGTVRWSQAEAVSADGSVVIGESRSVPSGNGVEAFRWTAPGGSVGLGDLPGGAFQSYAFAMTPDGATIVGRATIDGPTGPFGGGSAPRAFIWDSIHGMRDLQQVLIDGGASLADWSLQEARGISADGRTISGTGLNPQQETEAWVATLGAAPCYANCDGSTGSPILNVADFTCFFQRFSTGDGYANCGT